MLSINYESWHHMPNNKKNQALDNIKERFSSEVSDDYIKKALGKKWRDHKSTLKKQYFKKDISLEEKLSKCPAGNAEDHERIGTSNRKKQKSTYMTGSRSFAFVAEAEEKLKEKKAKYEAIASTDSFVNLENIDNRIITAVLGPERYGRIAQMQTSIVEQIAEVQRKYEELQQELKAEAAEREVASTAGVREAEAARWKGWILVKNVHCKSAKISDVCEKSAVKSHGFSGASQQTPLKAMALIGTPQQTPLKAMAFSNTFPTNVAKSLDLLWHFFHINAVKICGVSYRGIFCSTAKG
ncbi:hypothetical protein PVK06_047211 [Gossypium arboreum]|uniref:Uncharacterized protein n=1 Tax=Gossypium arboreum TaxID=29729 RepID=A0ABR0MD35_GOSAR|nr:hypothetical protein PVK06_047211 [Gossypium arboreum]